MTIFSSEVPSFVFSRKNTITLVLFTAVFALVFLNLYAPFGFRSGFWVNVTDLELLLYSSVATLTGMVVIAISRILMYLFIRTNVIIYRNYIIWIAVEIIAMALFYTLLQKYVLKDTRYFYNLLKLTIQNTALVLLIPYSVSWLYFSWLDKNIKLTELLSDKSSNASEPEVITPAMIPFKDSSKTMRITVKTEDFLYLEAADNYVIIYYLKGNKVTRFMLRNTLKNIENELNAFRIVRCHRSFMINFLKVKIIEKGKNGLQILLDCNDEITIPVSKTYANSILNFFANEGVDD